MTLSKKAISLAAVAFATVAFAPSAFADGITQISEGAFNASAGLITFSEFADGTANPVYTPSVYGGGAGSPTVTFGGYFTGQTAGTTNPSACPSGAAVTGCVLGNPTGPLSIAAGSPTTFITDDSAQPTTPVLSGTPTFNGSIAILFSAPQVGVGLDGGYFDSVGSTAITAFDANGNVIGSVSNSVTGIDFLGLVTSDGTADISGLLFSLVGDEPAGFDVDNIRFGTQGEVSVPGGPAAGVTPEPGSFVLLGTGALGALAQLRRRRSVSQM